MDEASLILASGSPRRRELLASLGLHFEVRTPDVDEDPQPGERPDDMVLRLASAKAEAVVAGLNGRMDGASPPLVLAADTTVVVDGLNLAKPGDHQEAAAFLRLLSGRAHQVHTGHALRLGDREATALRTTVVRFRTLEDDEIMAYAAGGEGLDKAGGYGIQGLGATLIEGIEGCYGAVVGLSLPAVLLAARELGVRLV